MRTEANDFHSLNNETKSDRDSVYRWVDKVKLVQIFRYPHRYLLEFQVPEPGAWWRWLQKLPEAPHSISPKPAPFTLDGNDLTISNVRLVPSQVNEQNYQSLGARYLAIGLEPPPSGKNLAVQVSSTSDMGGQNDVVYMVDKSLTVPTGYVATTWQASVMQSPRSNPPAASSSVTFGVGVAPPAPPAIPAASGGYAVSTAAQPRYLRGSVCSINTGPIPIFVYGYVKDS